jgi:exodeoxyribonuclease-3
MISLVSWNVNGLRAALTKGFLDFFRACDADYFCLQETKMQRGQAEIDLAGYHEYWHSAVKKGYSGTAIFCKKEPLSVDYGIGLPEFEGEGRVITLDTGDFYLVNCYTPNAQRELTRLDFRMAWEDAFREYLMGLDAKKPVVLCGDLNVAHRPIDLKNPKTNEGNAGFTPQERDKMTALLGSGFVDTFRHLHPDEKDAYSWWSYMFKARERNTGWRIDYFIVSDRLKDRIAHAGIRPDVFGSDHCPVELGLS